MLKVWQLNLRLNVKRSWFFFFYCVGREQNFRLPLFVQSERKLMTAGLVLPADIMRCIGIRKFSRKAMSFSVQKISEPFLTLERMLLPAIEYIGERFFGWSKMPIFARRLVTRNDLLKNIYFENLREKYAFGRNVVFCWKKRKSYGGA